VYKYLLILYLAAPYEQNSMVLNVLQTESECTSVIAVSKKMAETQLKQKMPGGVAPPFDVRCVPVDKKKQYGLTLKNNQLFEITKESLGLGQGPGPAQPNNTR